MFKTVHVKPIGTNWRRSRINALLSSNEAAATLGIHRKSLLNIETEQPKSTVSELLAAKAAHLYSVPVEHLVSSGGDGVPDEPPSKEQDQETNTGPGRAGGNKGRGGKDPKGPKRPNGVAA